METLMETKLTEQQAKMVIEYFAKKAAEEAPGQELEWKLWDKHMWMTQFEVSLAVGRKIPADYWEELVNRQLNLQLFDRNPDAFINEQGFALDTDKDNFKAYLEEQVNWGINNCWNNSGA